MATKIVPETNGPAKKLIFEKLEDAWEEVDGATKKVRALCHALQALNKSPLRDDDPGHQLQVIAAETMQTLWAHVDGVFTDLRDELGIKRADYATEASHG